MKRLFTLIELIIVIVILGILSIIVIPNISNIKHKATVVSLEADIVNMQKAVDMYIMDNEGELPSIQEPTGEIPQILDFKGKYHEYLRSLPKQEGLLFWIDSNKTVWGSTKDSPLVVSSTSSVLEWNAVEGAASYKLYKYNENRDSSSAYKRTLEYIKEIPNDNQSTYFYEDREGYLGTRYLVSTVDEYGLESAPVGMGYMGFPYEEWSPSESSDTLPIAVITKSKSIFAQGERVDWGYKDSYHPDGLEIVNVEWGGDYRDTYDNVGEHKVFLRVQDEAGVWSPIVQETIFVENSEDVSFGGVEGYVEIPNKKHYDLNKNQVTLEMWIKPNDWGVRESGCSSIFSKREINTSGIFLYADCDDDTLVVDLGGVKERWHTNYYAETDVWTHIAYTYDGKITRFYVNGKLENETNEHGDMKNLDNANIRIGKDFSFGKDDYYFDGSVKGVRLWEVSLSEAEINRNMNYFNNYNDNRLLGAWSIYENEENKVYDMSPYKNHGRFIYD